MVVLNGVEFRTRHNDYRLNMPSKTSNSYGAYEKIEMPEVPPEVSIGIEGRCLESKMLSL